MQYIGSGLKRRGLVHFVAGHSGAKKDVPACQIASAKMNVPNPLRLSLLPIYCIGSLALGIEPYLTYNLRKLSHEGRKTAT